MVKAYAGFMPQTKEVSQVVTGNWGCGAFGGDLRLKFLIQWVACSLTDKEMVYCPFGKSKEIIDERLFERLSKLPVVEVFDVVKKALSLMSVRVKGRFVEEVNLYELINEVEE